MRLPCIGTLHLAADAEVPVARTGSVPLAWRRMKAGPLGLPGLIEGQQQQNRCRRLRRILPAGALTGTLVG